MLLLNLTNNMNASPLKKKSWESPTLVTYNRELTLTGTSVGVDEATNSSGT